MKHDLKIPFIAEIRKCHILNQSIGIASNEEISISLYANNLKQNVSSENENVDIEEANDESTCLKSATWFAPILENKFVLEAVSIDVVPTDLLSCTIGITAMCLR